MRVAVCFIGMIRAGIESSENLKQWMSHHYDNIDFFMHTWDITESKEWHRESTHFLTSKQPQNMYKESSYFLIEKLKNIYDNKFISVEVENQETFLQSPFYSCFRQFSPQWYSWYKVMQLVDNYERQNGIRYDVVVKIRPDIIFPKERNLREEILNYCDDTSALYTLGYNPRRIDDVMFLGSSQIMKQSSKFMMDVGNKQWTDNHLGEWLQRKGIKALNTAHTTYAIYRKEHVEQGVSPMQFNKCVNVERDYYAPYNVDRLSEDEE
jgi:hypothetical protein